MVKQVAALIFCCLIFALTAGVFAGESSPVITVPGLKKTSTDSRPKPLVLFPPNNVQDDSPKVKFNLPPMAKSSVEEQVVNGLSKLNERKGRLADPNGETCAQAPLSKVSASNEISDFETLKQCGPSRTYLEKDLMQFPSWMRSSADTASNAEISRACIFAAMKGFYPASEKQGVQQYAYCAKADAPPVRGQRKPCVTDTYVNTTFNSLVHVANCMGYYQQDLFTTLMHESGVSINALSKDLGAGAGQFNRIAIIDVNRKFNSYKQKILSSSNPSCKKIADQVAHLNPISEIPSKRCGMLVSPPNPLLSMIYTVIRLKTDKERTDVIFKRGSADGSISALSDLIQSKGLSLTGEEEEKLKRLLATISYNSGVNGTLKLFEKYLNSQKSLSKADFNFTDKSYKNGRAISQEEKTFPQFAAQFTQNGTKGYLSKMTENIQRIEKDVGVGKCVRKKYSEL